MDSPLGRWLAEKNLTQADLACAAGISRSSINYVARGTVRLSGALRTYLEKKAPELVRELDRFHEVMRKELNARVEAA